jgi:hypothetical protein
VPTRRRAVGPCCRSRCGRSTRAGTRSRAGRSCR